ncbi:MAG: MBL fold metallo-hydrolase [Candidatus Krumholzibacteria bacterium]|nr:MBL fold metallo-hydrolase [Candidatus Krumholzibacteria bacterium]
MAIRVVILGTGTIIPSASRKSTSLLVEAHGETILFDCGPGALEAVERSGRSYKDIKRIFITHFHPDHTLGLGRLFSAMKNDGSYPVGGRIEIFGPAGLDCFIENWNGLYDGIVPGDDRLGLRGAFRSAGHPGGGPDVQASEADHAGKAAYAYRLDYQGSSVVFTGDTGYTRSIVELANGADLLVAECSFPDDRAMKGHLTPSSAGRIAVEAGVGRIVLVHLYPSMEEAAAIEGVKRIYDGPVEVASDGMEIDV